MQQSLDSWSIDMHLFCFLLHVRMFNGLLSINFYALIITKITSILQKNEAATNWFNEVMNSRRSWDKLFLESSLSLSLFEQRIRHYQLSEHKKINKSKSDDDYVCRWYDTSFRQFVAIYRNLPLSVFAHTFNPYATTFFHTD